jgi:hypothetical protein
LDPLRIVAARPRSALSDAFVTETIAKRGSTASE